MYSVAITMSSGRQVLVVDFKLSVKMSKTMEYRESLGANGYFTQNRDSMMMHCFNPPYVTGFKSCIPRDDRNIHPFFLFEKHRSSLWLWVVICWKQVEELQEEMFWNKWGEIKEV